MSVIQYDYTRGTFMKRQEKKLDGNYTRLLRDILNKFWKQHITKQQLYGNFSSQKPSN